MNVATNEIVAITGATGALGSAVARHLASAGYRVALFGTARGKGALDALVAELGPGRAVAHAGDLATAEAWTKALDATRAALGALPIHAVLVAGGWEGGAPLYEADDAIYAHMMQNNVDTAYRALRALLPNMVAARRGSIVAIGSRAAERPWTSAGAAAYAASKAAVTAMVQAVAEEVGPHHVRLNAILPSTLDTPANRAAMPKADPSKWVSLDSAAGVIAFLLSDAARDVSGAVIPVYGRA